MTHTSTSPNYQIIASLDVGRQQVELEAFSSCKSRPSWRWASTTPWSPSAHPEVLRVPHHSRDDSREVPSLGIELPLRGGIADRRGPGSATSSSLTRAGSPCYTGRSGIDGDTFKHAYLMDRYGIQVNKTARNSVLVMTHIGTNRSSVAYLIEVLVNWAGNSTKNLRGSAPWNCSPRAVNRCPDQRPARATGLQLFRRPLPE